MENEDVSGGESDWIEVQSPASTPKAHWYENNAENPMIVKDSFFTTTTTTTTTYSSLSPPSNHENSASLNKDQLMIEEQQQQQYLHDHPTSSSASALSDDDDDDHNKVIEEAKVGNGAGKWIRMQLGIFSSGIEKVVSRMRDFAVCKSAASMLLFASATTGVGAMLLVIMVLYYNNRRRAKRLQLLPAENKHHLTFLLREKDQKINKLMHQVAQLNDMLSARRRVPVLQVTN